MSESILTARSRERMAAHTITEQLEQVRAELIVDKAVNKLERLLLDRRIQSVDVEIERRGLNPQRKGFEQWRDNDTETDSI